MTGSENNAQNFLDRHGALVGIAGIALAMVFGVLLLVSPKTETKPGATTTTLLPVAATLPNIAVPDDSTPAVGTTPSTLAEGETEANGSVVAVKIDNTLRARPQVGLALASMIVEMPVEGGLTRFTAFFAAGETAPVVSPVRSLRWTDVLFVPLFSDAIVTTGGRDYIEGGMVAEGVEVFDLNSSVVVRNGGASPLNVEASLSSVPLGAPKSPFAGGLPVDSGTRPDVISIPFSGVEQVEWRWESGGFVRYSNGEQHLVTDEFGGESEAFSRRSVLVLTVVQRSAGYTDAVGADVPIFDLLGTGPAILATEDGMIEGVWIRLSKNDPFTILDGDGQAVRVPLEGLLVSFVPTFVEVSTR